MSGVRETTALSIESSMSEAASSAMASVVPGTPQQEEHVEVEPLTPTSSGRCCGCGRKRDYAVGEKRYYVHEDPKENCLVRCCCPDDSTTGFPRGARMTVCCGIVLLLAIVATMYYPLLEKTKSDKGGRYEDTPNRFDPDLSPTLHPSRQPTSCPSLAPVERVPSPSPTATPVPTIENVNPPGSIVSRYGWLSVSENTGGVNGTRGIPQILNERDVPFQLRGMSIFWSNTGWGAEKFWTRDVVRILVEDWNIEVIRCAVGVEDAGGYINDSAANWERLTTVVDAALEFGIYVIVDWHSHYAEDHVDRAISFFTFVSVIYGRFPNLIYEIYNEPITLDWAGVVKPYAETIIPVIRGDAPRNIILVGTPFYSQEINVAALDPVTGYDNIAYTFHFYAATHKERHRTKVEKALNNGIAVFCSEFGTVNADGDGDLDRASTREWIDFMNERNISWANWAVSDRDESTSILKDNAYQPLFDVFWPDSDLTESGLLIKTYLNL